MAGSFKIKSLFIIVLLFYGSLTCRAQVQHFEKDTTSVFKNEIGIDIVNFLTFLKKNSQSYQLNYKRYVFKSSAIRFGLNLDISSIKESDVYVSTRLGYEFGKQYYKWRLFYGSDFSYYYSKNNLQPNKNYRLGAEPLIGAKYYFSKHFSVSSEIKLNFFYYIYRNDQSFDPSANSEENELTIGSVGMFIFSFHF